MTKALAVVLVGFGLLYALALAVQHAFVPDPAAPPVAKSPRQIDDCSDDCEQRSIVERWPDGMLQRCRAACRGQAGPPRPSETPSRITVGRPDHKPGPGEAKAPPITVTPIRPSAPPPVAPPQVK